MPVGAAACLLILVSLFQCAGLSASSETALAVREIAALAERDAGGVFGEPNSAEHSLPLVREGGAWKVAASYLTEGE